MNEVKAAKHLGQHFLRDETVIARLLAVINAQAGERILEIGPGLGALTLPLLRQTGALTAVEYDPRVLAPLAKKAAPLGTLHLIHADILDINFGEVLAKQLQPLVGESRGGVHPHPAAAKSFTAHRVRLGVPQEAETITAPHSPAEMPPPPVGEGWGGGSKQPAPATSTPPSPCGGGDGSRVRPHTADAEPSAKMPPPSEQLPPPVGEGWGSKQPAPATNIPPSPRGGGDGGGVSPHTATTESSAKIPPPLRSGGGLGRGCENPRSDDTNVGHKYPTNETHTVPSFLADIPPSPCGGGGGGHPRKRHPPFSWEPGGGVSPHTAAAESPTNLPPPPVGEGWGGGSKQPVPATEKLRLVGNLPYNLSSPILFHCLAQRQHIHDMHYMLQKEVVDRITAAPGSKTYGRLSLMAQLWCETTALFDIPPDAFDPPPKVESAVVRLVPRAAPAWQIDDLATFDETVRLAFAQRRKMLRKTFAHWMSADTLAALAIDPTARAETLDGAAFARLANARYQQERQK